MTPAVFNMATRASSVCRIILLLDEIDGDVELGEDGSDQDGDDAEPSLGRRGACRSIDRMAGNDCRGGRRA
jgi:hypothetical protein